MSASRLRLLAAAMALGAIGAFAAPAAAATQPPPGSEGPAGPPALMPNGQVATPPQVTSPQISTSCPAAPYGAQSAAPGSGKTVALTFDDGPGASTASILSILAQYGVPATFFNLGQNMAARPALVQQEASMGYVLDNHTWDHANTDHPVRLGAGRRDGPGQRRASEPDRHPALRVPPARRQLQLHHAEPGAAAPDDGLDLVGGHRGLEGERLVVGVLGEPDHHPGRTGGRRADAPGRAHAQPAAGNPATVLALPTIIQYFGSHGYTFVDLLGRTAVPTPGNWGDEVNPFGNGFDVFHQHQAVNAIIAGWTATKADPATHFIRLPGTVPGAYRFEYAPNGVATGLSVSDPGYDAAGTGLKDGLVLRASNTGPWQQFIPQPNGTLKNLATGLYVSPNGTGAQLRGTTAPSPWGGSVYTWTDYAHLHG